MSIESYNEMLQRLWTQNMNEKLRPQGNALEVLRSRLANRKIEFNLDNIAPYYPEDCQFTGPAYHSPAWWDRHWSAHLEWCDRVWPAPAATGWEVTPPTGTVVS